MPISRCRVWRQAPQHRARHEFRGLVLPKTTGIALAPVAQPHLSAPLVNHVEVSLGRLRERLSVVIRGAWRDGDCSPEFLVRSKVELERDVCTSPSGRPLAWAVTDMIIEAGVASACLFLAWTVRPAMRS